MELREQDLKVKNTLIWMDIFPTLLFDIHCMSNLIIKFYLLLQWAAQLLTSYRNLEKEKDQINQPIIEDSGKAGSDSDSESFKIVDFKENPEEFNKIISNDSVMETNLETNIQNMKDTTSTHGSSSSSSSTLTSILPNISSTANKSSRGLSISEQVKFVSCCSKNKSSQNKESNEIKDVDMTNMVCMRPKDIKR